MRFVVSLACLGSRGGDMSYIGLVLIMPRRFLREILCFLNFAIQIPITNMEDFSDSSVPTTYSRLPVDCILRKPNHQWLTVKVVLSSRTSISAKIHTKNSFLAYRSCFFAFLFFTHFNRQKQRAPNSKVPATLLPTTMPARVPSAISSQFLKAKGPLQWKPLER